MLDEALVKPLVILGAYGFIFLVGEIVHRRLEVKGELTRGWEHLAAGCLSAALPAVLTFHQIAVICAILAALAAASMHLHLFTSMHEVSRRTWGEVFFPLGLLILALLIPREPSYVYGALVMGVGDAVGALVGARLGRHHHWFGGSSKTYAGSLAFMVCSAAAGIGVLLANGVGVVSAVPAAVVAAILLTPVEAALIAGLDDLVLPAAAGVTMLGLLRILR